MICGWDQIGRRIFTSLVLLSALFWALPAQTAPQKAKALPAGQVLQKFDPRAEETLLKWVNRERTARGLPELALDPRLREVARAHSRDMAARRFFDHTTPEGVDYDKRLTRAGIRWNACAENIALDIDIEGAHANLMASPGHQKNLLNPNYRRIGIGIWNAGVRGIYVTQDFAD